MKEGESNEPPGLDRQVRYRIYQHFVARAGAPAAVEIARELGVSQATVVASLHRLTDQRKLVLAPGSDTIWMAHPFSATPTAFPVRTRDRLYWANCAWDALGIPALLGLDAEITTMCGDCGDSISLRVSAGELERADSIVHFQVPPKRFWENVGFT